MEVLKYPKRQIPVPNVMAIRKHLHANVSRERYWMALMLVLPNSPYMFVGMSSIDPFMKA